MYCNVALLLIHVQACTATLLFCQYLECCVLHEAGATVRHGDAGRQRLEHYRRPVRDAVRVLEVNLVVLVYSLTAHVCNNYDANTFVSGA